MTISGYNPETSNSVALIFVCIKHNYTITYIKIFEGLKELFNFDPEIIHTVYEIALEKSINEINIFTKKPIHIKCNFHFSKALRAQMIKCGMCKKN